MLERVRLPQPWTPLALSDAICLWLKGDDLRTMSFVTGVSQWRDKSPFGNHASEATGARQPLVVISTVSGKSVLRFASQQLGGALTLSGATFSVFIVATMQSGAATTGRGLCFAAAGAVESTAGGFTALRRDSTNQNIQAHINNTAGVVQAVTYDTPFLWSVITTAAAIKRRFNGGSEASTAIVPSVATTRYEVGTNLGTSAPGSSYWANDVYELIVMPSTIVDYWREYIEGYLMHEHRLSSLLPATHPFQMARPYA